MDIIAQFHLGLALVKLFAIATCATFCLAIAGGMVSVVVCAIVGGVSRDR